MTKIFVKQNLQASVFDDVDLSNSTIKGSNLSNLSITGSNIRGLKINGVEIKPLIEAELEKQDPARKQLKISNIYDSGEVKKVYKIFNKQREDFYDLLLKTPTELLLKKPNPADWSAFEIVRHLLFSEDLRINYWILRKDELLSPYGLLPSHIKQDGRFKLVGTKSTNDIKEIIAEWQKIHKLMHDYILNLTDELLRISTKEVDFGQGDIAHVIQDFFLHELEHIRQVEKLISTNHENR